MRSNEQAAEAADREAADSASSRGVADDRERRPSAAVDAGVILGDCVQVMAEMPAENFDAIVTDPPYGLGFMGKEWDSVGAIASRPPSADETDERYRNVYPRTGKGPKAVAFEARGYQAWCTTWATEALRVAKPGAHLLAFGGTRTYHRLTCALEDAGWEIRDCLVWAYASGFPKSLDVSKAIDKANGRQFEDRYALGRHIRERRLAVGLSHEQVNEWFGYRDGCQHWERQDASGARVPTLADWVILQERLALSDEWRVLVERVEAEREVIGERERQGKPPQPMWSEDSGQRWNETAPATDAAKRWQGWGTALKPAWEPIVLARKPLQGTVAGNVQRYGTGALNIDATRIGVDPLDQNHRNPSVPFDGPDGVGYSGGLGGRPGPNLQAGRWPPNLLLTDAELFDVRNDGVVGSGAIRDVGDVRPYQRANRDGYSGGMPAESTFERDGDTGGYARFFLVPKASRSDREPVWDEELVPGGTGLYDDDGYREPGERKANHTAPKARRNVHPTTKPVDLMRHLVRLITPPGGRILDPFLGSGTTAIAAIMEGFECVGIEREPEYVAIAEARLNGVQQGIGL